LLGNFKRVTKADHQSLKREQPDSGVAEHGKGESEQQPFDQQQQQEQHSRIRHEQQLKITLPKPGPSGDDWAEQLVSFQL
jgi:hypothetical protein